MSQIEMTTAPAPAPDTTTTTTEAPPTEAKEGPPPVTEERPPEETPPAEPAAAPAVAAPAPATAPASTAITTSKPTAPIGFIPKDTAEMWRLSVQLSASALIPQSLQGKPSDVMVVLMKGRDLGLTPMQSLSEIHVINGKAGISALMMLALVKKSPLCLKWQLVESTGERAAFMTQRRGDDFPVTFEYTLAEAHLAKLHTKGRNPSDAPWNTQPRTMLRRRAQSLLLREIYPDVVIGLYDHDEINEMREALYVEQHSMAKLGIDQATIVQASGDDDVPSFTAPPPVIRDTPPPPVDPLKARMAARRAEAPPVDDAAMTTEGDGFDCKGCSAPVMVHPGTLCSACRIA